MNLCTLCPKYRRPAKKPLPAEVGSVCRICLGVVDQDIGDLVRLAPDIAHSLAPRSSGPGAGHAAPGPRLPVSLDALNLIGPRSPAYVLRDWAITWALTRSLGVHGPREYGTTAEGHIWLPVTNLGDLGCWLRQHLTWAAYGRDFATFAGQVHGLLGQVRRLVLDGAYPRPVGWCPAARNSTGDQCLAPLSATTWVDVITCPACGAHYDRGRGDWSNLVQLGVRTEERRSA